MKQLKKQKKTTNIQIYTFYNHCRIIQEDEDLERARLALVTAVRITIANSLAILGVSAPEKM